MHPNDPTLPTRPQAPQQAANLAVLDAGDSHIEETYSFEYARAAATQIMTTDPPNLAQVWMQTDWPKWDQSICCKLEQLEQMGAWELVYPPKDANIVGSCFIFHYKHNATGEIASHKVRLVAQGFSQQEGIDYNETFSPTAKLSAICIIAAVATWNDWELKQMDVDSAYLNAPLTEMIYM